MVQSSKRLYVAMLTINVISFILLFCLPSLVHIHLDNTKKYTATVEPFAPDVILDLAFYEPIPVQAIDIGWGEYGRLYLPGLALDCTLGIIQGIVLGLNLLMSDRRKHTKDSIPSLPLPAINMFLYAGMCCSALPIHCFRDVVKFNVWPTSPEFPATLFLWMDIFCTACVPAIMLLDTLAERRLLDKQHVKVGLIWIFLFNGAATRAAVMLGSRWAGFVLHVLSMLTYGVPIYALAAIDALVGEPKGRGNERITCLHSMPWLLSATACIVLISLPSGLFAVPLSRMTNRAFDAHAGIFVGCRCGIVQYWAYCKRRANCQQCNNEPIKVA